MESVYDLVLFDLDGTLTKSDPGITGSVIATLNEMHLAIPQNLYSFIGPPLYASFQEHCHMADAQAQEAVLIYRKFYNESGIFKNAVYPGILELLQSLRESGATLGVATSKPQPQAEMVLNHFKIAPFLDVICGANPDERSSTKTQLIEKAVAACKAEKSRTVMIGDTCYDAFGAKNAGVNFIGVLYGYGSQEEIEQEGGRAFVKSAQELKNLLIL
ncbi:MAG TPA: HAD hydrolase-like protein [Oscillospiraceae bacterium]|nr:HAD hydrolase-like protein [Oscillospiraceae bacterium]